MISSFDGHPIYPHLKLATTLPKKVYAVLMGPEKPPCMTFFFS